MMKSSSNGGVGGGAGRISIAASTKIVVVDNRISLRLYYRIADSLLRQADIYREEKNIIDLYIMLLRFSSLINETIPKHRDYQFSNTVERNSFKKKLVKALDELDALKPEVVRRIDQLNRTSREASRWGQDHVQDNVVVRHHATNQQFPKYEIRKAARSFGQQSRNSFSQGPNMRSTFSQAKLNDERIQKLSLSIPRAREETLSKHSILGPNGLHGQWQPPRIDNAVKYPSSLDLTPIEFPSMQPAKEDESKVVEDANHSAESVVSLHDQVLSLHIEEPSSVVTLGKIEIPGVMNLVGQPSPPPVLAEVQDVVVVAPSQVSDPISVNATSLEDELIRAEDPLQVHISTNLMDMFMKLAKSNTNRNLETCGVLAGSLKNRKFYITSLIIPKQESTSDSCQTTNEEEIFEYQDKESLFPLGWIHTHPTQSCFMSSIDVHTHYSYQTMLPEAIAIVMAPKDVSRKHGIFRLTTPGGMSVIRKCNLRGFHPHEQPPGGGPIYDHCDVYMDPKLKFDVVDFR